MRTRQYVCISGMGTGLVHCSEHWTKVEQNEQMNNEHLIFDPLNTWTWTRFFWACSEHMNMNTLISMLFNFCSCVQLLFKLFWTKVEHWTLCSEHCSQVVHLFKIFSFLIRYIVIRYIIIRFTMWVINFTFTHIADWKGQNPIREKVDYLWKWSSPVGIEIRLIVTRNYRTTDL